MANWIEVFQSDNTLVAQIKAQILEQQGIKTMLRNEHLAALVGMGGLGLPCRIFVHAQQVEKAALILKKSDGPKLVSSTDEPLYCPKCNAPWEIGFQICWKCEQ